MGCFGARDSATFCAAVMRLSGVDRQCEPAGVLGLQALLLTLASAAMPPPPVPDPLGRGAPSLGSSRVEIATEGEAACVDEAQIRARLRAYLAASHAAPDPQAGQVLVEVGVAQAEPTVEATLSLTTAAGHSTRALQAATCAELVDAVALVAAMAVDPLLEVGSTAPVAGPSPKPVPAAEPGPQPEPDPQPEPEPGLRAAPEADVPRPPARTRPLRGLAWVAGGIAGGLLPCVGGVVEVGGGVHWRRLRAMAVATFQLPRERHVASGSIVLSAWGVGAHGCYVPAFGRFELAGCAMFEAGQVLGTGRNFASDRTDRRPWVGIGLRGATSVRITRWLLVSLEAQLLGHVLQPRFAVTGTQIGRTTAPTGVRAMAGLQLRLL